MDATPLPIIAEIQAMKEQMEVMMNALKGRVSSDLNDLVNKTDSPFTPSINSFPLPQKFRMPQIESYDGVKDPLDHLETFWCISKDYRMRSCVGLSYYVERTRQDLVQYTDTKFDQNF